MARKKIYALLRRLIPSIREQHRLDSLIGPIGFWKEIQTYQLNFLVNKGMKPHHILLDVGCGPLSGGIAFIRYLDSGGYYGLDVNSESIEEAHNQVLGTGLSAKNPTLITCNDFGKKELSARQLDFVWASQILYHLSEEQIDSFFAQIATCMKRDSKCFGDIIGHPNNVKKNSRWREFSFHLHDSSKLREMGSKYGLRLTTLGRIEDFGYPGTLDLKTNEMLEITKD